MRFLKQSTSVDVPIGPFLDSSDGVTAETALTITQPDVRLKKNNANWAQKAAAQTLTHEENGNYEVTLDATDTDTLGLLRLHVAESGALPVWEDFMVMPANVWDSLFGADALQVHANEITNGLITAAAIATGAIDADAIADNAIDAGAIADNAITSAKLATDCIGAAQIAANAIDASALAADAVTEIQSGLATPTNITAAAGITLADGAITAAKIATDAITADKIAADAIGASELAADAVTEIQSGLSTLTAAGVRTAVGLASANLDTQLDALPTAAENLAALLVGGNFDGLNFQQALKVILAALGGKVSGAAANAPVFRDIADTKNRITATTDADGNRTAVTIDAT